MASIYQSIEILGKEKGIDPQIILDAVKDAMLVAARKHFRLKPEEEMGAEFDKQGALQIYTVKRVVESVADPVNELTLIEARRLQQGVEVGGEVRHYFPTVDLGRIAAQTAKQVILQKVREAERDTVFKQFTGREGELVQCSIKRVEGMDLLVEIEREKIEARLPKREQSRLDSFQINDRIKCVIKGVERAGKNSGVVVSRAAPELVMRLFEQEVPEIYDNTVVIKACAREAGERTKIAVWSRDRDVDSVADGCDPAGRNDRELRQRTVQRAQARVEPEHALVRERFGCAPAAIDDVSCEIEPELFRKRVAGQHAEFAAAEHHVLRIERRRFDADHELPTARPRRRHLAPLHDVCGAVSIVRGGFHCRGVAWNRTRPSSAGGERSTARSGGRGRGRGRGPRGGCALRRRSRSRPPLRERRPCAPASV